MVVATNIAETSVTIDGVVFVVDCGFVKVSSAHVFAHAMCPPNSSQLLLLQQLPVYDAITGMDSLIVQPVSKVSSGRERT